MECGAAGSDNLSDQLAQKGFTHQWRNVRLSYRRAESQEVFTQ